MVENFVAGFARTGRNKLFASATATTMLIIIRRVLLPAVAATFTKYTQHGKRAPLGVTLDDIEVFDLRLTRYRNIIIATAGETYKCCYIIINIIFIRVYKYNNRWNYGSPLILLSSGRSTLTIDDDYVVELKSRF